MRLPFHTPIRFPLKQPEFVMDRRTFLQTSGAAALGSLCLGSLACGAQNTKPRMIEPIGFQLYTVRSLMEKDVPGTLEQVAAIGYREVEFHDYFGHAPAAIREMLDGLGLRAPSIHTGLDVLTRDLDGSIEAARTAGHRYLVCPSLDEKDRATLDGYRRVAEQFNRIGERCREAGLALGFHNHADEFVQVGGRVPYDLLLDETDPDLVTMEVDLFWMTKAGYDPLAYFERYPGRFSLCHVKDMDAAQNMVDVGAGVIDFAAIFAQAEQAGLRHYFVEHDEPADPMASARTSYAYLDGFRF